MELRGLFDQVAVKCNDWRMSNKTGSQYNLFDGNANKLWSRYRRGSTTRDYHFSDAEALSYFAKRKENKM